MEITKIEIISAIKKHNEFKILDDWKSESSIMIEWNKRNFFISFNEINDSDLDYEKKISNMASADFNTSAIFKPSGDLSSPDAIFHRYIIANKVNVDINFPSMVMYRESADLYEITVRHKNFFTNPVILDKDINLYIQGAVLSMLLSLMLTTKKLGDEFKKYNKETEGYINLARMEGDGKDEA
jgi:hypothetical protein